MLVSALILCVGDEHENKAGLYLVNYTILFPFRRGQALPAGYANIVKKIPSAASI